MRPAIRCWVDNNTASVPDEIIAISTWRPVAEHVHLNAVCVCKVGGSLTGRRRAACDRRNWRSSAGSRKHCQNRSALLPRRVLAARTLGAAKRLRRSAGSAEGCASYAVARSAVSAEGRHQGPPLRLSLNTLSPAACCPTAAVLPASRPSPTAALSLRIAFSLARDSPVGFSGDAERPGPVAGSAGNSAAMPPYSLCRSAALSQGDMVSRHESTMHSTLQQRSPSRVGNLSLPQQVVASLCNVAGMASSNTSLVAVHVTASISPLPHAIMQTNTVKTQTQESAVGA